MAFQLSPSVLVTEKDLTSIIPKVATSTGAMVGQFSWGPVGEIQTISSEDELATAFGKPNDTNFKDFFSAANFLAYASNLKVVRAIDETTAKNASATASAAGTGLLIKNEDHYTSIDFTASANLWLAKHPGVLGNSIGVAWADATGFDEVDSDGLHTWDFAGAFDGAPGTNEFHVVVYDATGTITGTAGTILERFAYVSTTATAKNFDGSSAYFKTRINNESAWVWVGKSSLLADSSNGVTLAAGHDGAAVTDANRQTALSLFVNPEGVDISLIFAAGAATTTAKWIIDNIAEVRKDCVALVSPAQSDVVGVASDSAALAAIKVTRTALGSSSYAFMDSAYKYQYDRYNDVNRWVPLNGDVAGIMARTDAETDPWFSPAGLNRGRIKNCIKLSQNQNQTYRDELYKVGVNPCTIFPNEGPVLFGDKTLLTRPSAFDRINVRRLFIVLEKAIATASKYQLFELNDEYTRTNFVNTIEPFLKDVQGRRGIYEYRVVCDSTNNTANVIDSNEFVGDIYIRPARSINYIKLNFIAVRNGISFDEIVQGATV